MKWRHHGAGAAAQMYAWRLRSTRNVGDQMAAIAARIAALKRIRKPWIQDARNRIQQHGLAALLEVKYVDQQGC